MAGEPDNDRRESARVPGSLVVRMRFPKLEDFRYRYTRDISRGGVFIQTLKPRPTGSAVVLVLEQVGRDENISLNAQVVTAIGPEEAVVRGLQPGMGIRFLDLDGDKRRAIEEILASDMPTAEPPPGPRPPPSASAKLTTERLDLEQVEDAARRFLAASDAQDCYQMLEVTRDANSGQIRRAYLKRTRRFHPDNYFRRAPAAVCEHLEDIYDRLTRAYETLMDRDRRITYDLSLGYLGGNRDGVSPEEMQRVAAEERRRKADPARMGRADQLYGQALKEIAAGEVSKAMHNLRLALAFDPENEQIGARLAELKEQSKKNR